jgi:hypothetical protein
MVARTEPFSGNSEIVLFSQEPVQSLRFKRHIYIWQYLFLIFFFKLRNNNWVNVFPLFLEALPDACLGSASGMNESSRGLVGPVFAHESVAFSACFLSTDHGASC